MVRNILNRVEQVVAERLPLEALKERVLTVGGQGLQAAIEIAERLHTRLTGGSEAAKSEPVAREERPIAAQVAAVVPEVPREQIQATATRILDEARAVEERIKKAQTARRPLQVTVEVDSAKVQAKGRKAAPSAAAARRVTAPKSGFKAKRGQKHSH